MKKESNKRILVVSDLHLPFCHKDALLFLSAVAKKYSPDCVVCMGDEMDGHALSFWPKDPDLDSAGAELEDAKRDLKKLYALFPNVDILESNHGSLILRKAKDAGLPRAVIRSYNEILGAPNGWRWHRKLVITASNGQRIAFHHGKSRVPNKVSKSLSMSSVESHFHSVAQLSYWGNSEGLYFSMHVGSLIDDESLAFEYNKLDVDRPILSVGYIEDGVPRILPMICSKGGRWNRRVP